MLINNIDISDFKAKQLTVDIQPSNIILGNDWLKQALLPISLSETVSFKDIKIELVIEDDSRDMILKDISNLLSKMIGQVILKLDGYANNYISFLNKSESVKTVSDKVYKLTIECQGYEIGSEVSTTANRVASKVINVDGNLKTIATIEITPSIDIIDLVVTGFGDTFTIKNLTQGQKVIVDGEDFIITQNGINKFADWDGWGVPKLIPGDNTITFSKTSCDVTIKYKPRWV